MAESHDPKVDINYNVVLADMKAKYAALGQSIAGMEAWLKGGGAPLADPDGGGGGHGHHSTKIDVDTFVGLTIQGAAARFLGMVGKPARTTEVITEALNKGGLDVSRPSVATILGREHTAGGDVRRVAKGLWGLKQWYETKAS